MTLQEVVSLGVNVAPSPQQLQKQTGTHLSPQQWHDHLQRACQANDEAPVLLDARNIYETRIGHFSSVSPSSPKLQWQAFSLALGINKQSCTGCDSFLVSQTTPDSAMVFMRLCAGGCRTLGPKAATVQRVARLGGGKCRQTQGQESDDVLHRGRAL